MKSLLINNKRVEIYDNFFSFEEKHRFYNFALNSSYSLGRYASPIPESTKLGATLTCNFSIDDIISFSFFNNKNIQKLINHNELKIDKCYITLSTSSDNYYYHIDNRSGLGMTSLCYLNIEWDPTWEGETHFSNDNMDDIELSVTPKAGRLVLFDGSIPHKSSQPSTNSPHFRYVFVTKYVTKKQPDYNKFMSVDNLIN
jgi:hypothetical protein